MASSGAFDGRRTVEVTREAAPVLEREAEIEALRLGVDAAARGSGAVVVVSGEAGAGKSTLLGVVEGHASAEGLHVLSARGLESEQEFGFGLVVRLLESSLFDADQHEQNRLLAGPARPARRLFGFPAADPRDPARGLDHGGALVHALVWLFRRLAGQVEGRPARGLVLVVDDVHWADPLSLRVLTRLAVEAGGLPISLVLGLRSTSDLPVEPLVGLTGIPGVSRLSLAPLSPHAVGIRVRDHLPQATDEVVMAVHELSGGNPFYVEQLILTAQEGGLVGASADAGRLSDLVPSGVRTLVARRLQRLPTSARAIASALAVLGDDTPLRRTTSLSGLDAETAEAAAELLMREGLVRHAEPLAFRHPIDRAVVYVQLPVMARSRAHRTAANLLVRENAAIEAIGRHLLASRADADPEVVELLRRAAARAAAHGDHRSAQRFLARALDEPPAEVATRAGLLGELALAAVASGDPRGLGHLNEALEVTDDPQRRAQLSIAMARMQFSLSRFDDAAESLLSARAELPPGDPLAEELTLNELMLAPFVAHRQQRAAEDLGRVGADVFAGRLEGVDRPLLALVAGAMSAAGRPAADVRRVASAAVSTGQDRFYDLASGQAVLALLAVDEPELARPTIEQSLRQAETDGSLIGLGFSTHWRAAMHHHVGNLRSAVDDAERNLDIWRAGWGICLNWVSPLLATAFVELGRLDDAERVLALSRDAEGIEVVHVLQARARLDAARGDHAKALEGLLVVGRAAGDSLPPTMSAWRSDAALAARAVGDLALARSLAIEEVDRARVIGARRTLGIALRAAGLVSARAECLSLLQESVAVLAESPSRLEYARSLVELGAAQHSLGDSACSRVTLRQAAALAQDCGAVPLADRAVSELRAAGGRRSSSRRESGAVALTATESRVARLAAEERTTADIAAELYLSPKTVGWHLTNVYRKLDVHSRRELAERLPPSDW